MSGNREVLEVDVLVVGGGPAGLSAAYHLARLMREAGREITIAVLEKGREVGAHSMSGAVLDPSGLDELLPDWKERGAPIESPVLEEEVCFLTARRAWRLPVTPPPLRNRGFYVISLNRFVRWFAAEVESAGVDLLPGFAGARLLMDGERVAGVGTPDRGLDREGRPKPNFEPGIEIRASVTVLAEGARGSLTKDLVGRLGLDRGRNPQVYSIGVKEVWEAPGDLPAGRVVHTMGFPLSGREFGGGFLYTMAGGRVSLGLVVGLDYRNPALDPHERLQAFKSHPLVAGVIGGGELACYGASAIPEGGHWAVPRCHADGALIIGDSAGLVDAMRLKGIHLAIKSGMLAAETLAVALVAGDTRREALASYDEALRASWAGRQLWKVRNFHQGFRRGLWAGLAHAALQTATGGRGVRNRYPAEPGHTRLERLDSAAPPKPPPRIAFDGVRTFDRLTSVHASGVRHEEDQPSHLVVISPDICHPRCTREYGNPCQHFCPAEVYRMAPDGDSGLRLEIQAANCIHCKTCDIMDPYQVIDWRTPEGGDGPDYRYL
jgi:electron-transferring-flavoprotein dehydrogenase